jgi:hypothetical protein
MFQYYRISKNCNLLIHCLIILLLLLYLDTTQVFASTPTIGSIETQSTHINTATNPISFTVSDGESGPLTIICSTSNSLFVSNTAFNLENSGHWIYVVSITGGENKALTLIITPENGSSGTCDITITVIDSEDLSGSTHFLLIVSPPGAGNALNFNGEGKGVSATIATKNTNFCMELWIKWSGSFGNYPYFVSFIACNGSTGSKGFAIYLTPDTRYLGYFCSSGFGIDNIGRTPLVDEWEHVALVINEGTLSFYANGVLELTATGTPSELDGFLNLGNSGNTQEYYIGQIDELRIWDAPRSETQIRDNMCKRLIGNETNLVTYYRFDHSSGTELKDLSRNGNHGILNNMNNGNWVLSSAAIGDMSTYDYNGTIASDFVVNLTSPNGDQLTATGDGGSYSSMHIYLINESPNVTSPPTGWNAIDTDHYWGIFPVGTNPTYEITYNYNGNPFVSDENAMKLAYRKDNSISLWSRSTATINTGANTITKNNETRAEYILAENMIEISTIESQSTSLSEIPFTITHQTGDNVNVTVTSLNESLIENAKIDVAGSGSNSYTQLMTAGVPVSLTITVIAADNINGFVTLTVTATDSNGVTITNDCRVIISPPGTGPGGIGRIDGLSHLELWLRSDMGVNYSSTDLVSWENQSGYTGRDANNVGGAPDYLDNQINGYPMISFDGVNDYLTGSTPSLNFSDSNLTLFLVSAIHQIPSDNYYGIFSLAVSGLNDWDDPDGMCFSLHPTNSLQCNMLQYYGSNKMEVFKDVGSTSFQIFTLERNNGNACITINALNTDSDTYSDSSPIKPDKYIISARWTSGSVDSNMRGENDYAEIIIYNGALANVEQNIIHNYLSAKYNIAIASADKYSGDTTANGDFDMDVAGIGKDTEGINNIANSGGLILNGTNFLVDNGDYIFAGHAENSNGFVAENTSSEINRRMLRIWYIDRTDGGGANNGNLTISFDYSDAGLLDAPSDANMYSLLFRSDRNSDFTILPVLSMEINGDKIIFEISDNYLLDGYYTLGTFETEISDIQDQIESSIHYINQTAVLYFSITSNDAPCSLTITMISSDTSILPNENLSVVCENNHYTATLQPLTNMSGSVNITLVATSANGLTSSSTIALMFSSNLSGAGRALSFDGIDDLIDLSQVPTTGSGAFTIEAWIKTSEQGRRKQIVNYGDLSTNNGAWLLINPSDQLEMDWSNTAGPTSTLIITDGIWHHVVGVYESGNITLYVDGNPDGSASIATPNIGTSMARIGYPLPSNGAEWIYKGQMDDIRIWNIARTEAQIQTNMNKKLIGTESGLVAYYRFDHTNGDTLLDLTAYENHGFLTQTMDTVASWTVSTAPIGDFSHSGAGVSNLTATETVPVTITWTDDPGADAFYSAIQVNDFPEKTTGLLLNYPATYWEIYLAKPDMAVTGTIAFKYDDVGIVEDENNLQLYGRATAIADWVALTGITLDVQGNSNDGLGSIIISNHDILSGAKQFILTSDSTDNCFFSVSSITNQTVGENESITDIRFTVSNPTGSLTISSLSSNTIIVPNENISVTGSGNEYTLAITPASGESGQSNIMLSISDGSYTITTEFDLTISAILPPEISSISNQNTAEDTTIDAISFMITDTNASYCSLTITFVSSNIALIPIENISYTCNSGAYTLTVDPAFNQSGTSMVTVMAESLSGLTATRSFSLTVTEINDTPQISSISNQFIGGAKVVSITFTATDPESSDCTLDLTITSSNQTLIPDSNLTYACDADNYTITATKMTNEFGYAMITVVVDDGTATSEKQFTITTLPTISFNPISKHTPESLTIVTINTTLSFASEKSISADYSITGGTASSGIDYTLTGGTLTFMPGQTSKSFTCTVSDDLIEEFSETVLVGLSNFVNVTETGGANCSFTLTIMDNDSPIFISSIEEQTTNINTAISIVLSVSQTEAQPLTLIIQSSDIGLVLANTISITGTGAIDIGSNYLLDVSENIENYTATIVPETDASGSCEITFTVINPTGVKDQSIFILNITNGAPDISLFDPQVTLENLSISLALSITDTINGVMSLTGVSSNEVLVTSQGLQFTHASMGANSNGYLLTVLRNEPETITLTITPSIDAYGNSEISITIINSSGLTASESFMLTVVDAASRSISFDGINDHIIYDTHFSVDPTNAIAIESWIYLYTNTTDMAILSYGNELHDSIVLEHKNYNLEMRLKNISKTEFVNFRNLSADGLPMKKWYHVCVMWNNSLNKAYCLINGQLRHGDTFSSDAIGYSGSRQLNIGSFFGQNKWFQGRLDDIRLWKTALPITTIRQWMYQVITEEHPYYSDLVACYPISAVAGNLIFDNRNHHHAYLYENSIIGSGPTRSQFVAVNNWLNTHTNDWNDPMNWSGHFVPTENNPGFVIINAGIRKPVLSVASSVNNLVLPVGASYMASTPYPLTVHGKIYNRLNASNINIGHSLTIFSSIDFKTDRIPPESIDYSITVAPSESSIHLIFMMATDDQSLTSSLQYAVVMSDYSLSCVDTISHIAGNITPCDAQLVIPFQTVSESGSGETIRSAGGNSAEVDVESLDSNNNYYFNVLVMDGDNNIRGYQAVQFGGIGE